MNLNSDSVSNLLNREIARRDSIPPFACTRVLPEALIECKDGFARICAWHGRDHAERVKLSAEATDWALAQGLRTTHGACPVCAAREMAALRALPAA